MIKKLARAMRNQSNARSQGVFAATLRWQIEGSRSTLDMPRMAPEMERNLSSFVATRRTTITVKAISRLLNKFTFQ